MNVSGPNLLIIGAARSGTTAVAEALGGHPDAFLTRPKEPHFLAFAHQDVDFRGPGDHETINRVAITEPDAYRALFAGERARVAVRVEASVSTLYHPDAAIPNILAHAAPDVRLVAILRDPVARAFSSFQYLRVRGMETAETLAEGVAREDERVEAGYHHLWHYTRMSRYAEQLAPFVATFGDRLLVLDHDALVEDARATLSTVARHVGLDPAGLPQLGARQNASGQPRSELLQRWLQRAVRSPVRPLLKAVVPYALRERIRAANLRPTTATPADSRAVRARIEDDLHRLPDIVEGLRPRWLQTPDTP